MLCHMFATIGDSDDTALAFFESPPVGLELRDYYIRQGKRLGKHYPADARIKMDHRSKGNKLASMLGNTMSFLIVHTDVKKLIETNNLNAEIEYLPVNIYNHKGRLQSSDYWIINVIGTLDCVDKEKSDIDYEDETRQEVIGVGTIVLDGKKLRGAPDLFRVPEQAEDIIASDRLYRILVAGKFSNLAFSPIEVA